jgi:hypothetical protein
MFPHAEGRPVNKHVVIRESTARDGRALSRLAQLDSRRLRDGIFLIAEVDGEMVAATPLDGHAASIANPFRKTEHIRELLELAAAAARDGSPPAAGSRFLALRAAA